MNPTLQDHPFWQTLDRSTRRMLVDRLEPIEWSDLADLQRLAAGEPVLGYVAGGQALTANAGCLTASTKPAGALPHEGGHGWRIAADVLAPLLHDQEASLKYLQQAHATPCSAQNDTDAGLRGLPRVPFSMSAALGWLMVIASPLTATLLLDANNGVSAQLAQWLFFMAALASGLGVWIFNLAPPFVGALLALLLMVIGSNLPAELAFAGLSSGNFYLLLGMLGISAAVQQSGLIERMLGAVLRHLPHGPRTVQAAVLVTGVLMSVFIPSTSGRLQLVVPMVQSFAKSGQRAALAFAALSGCTLFSTAFLMGNAGNFIVLGILPEHWQPHVNWTMWFKGAGVYVLVLALLLAATVLWQKPDAQDRSMAPAAQAPKPFAPQEGIVALALLCLTLGMGLGNVHHIETAWVTLFIFLLLVASGVLSLHRLASDIHWPMLIYLVCTVGFARGFAFTGLDEWIGSHLGELTALMRSAQVQFLWLLIAIVVLLRLLLPTVVCVTTLCAVLMPLADTFGLNPWVIGFIVLTASEAWFFPHQSTDYLLFRESTGLGGAESRQLLRANGWIQACRLLALGLSIPYWQYLGYVQ
jgi:di/tricarboxylate transporter